MDAEKIYKALENDNMSSALYIVVSELEKQGYRVQINDLFINSRNILEEKYTGIEAQVNIKVNLFKAEACTHNFHIEFNDYHRINIVYNK